MNENQEAGRVRKRVLESQLSARRVKHMYWCPGLKMKQGTAKPIDCLLWRVARPRGAFSNVQGAESCTHSKEGGEPHAVIAHSKVVWFGPDDLHYVLIELGLLPLLGNTMQNFSGMENIDTFSFKWSLLEILLFVKIAVLVLHHLGYLPSRSGDCMLSNFFPV